MDDFIYKQDPMCSLSHCCGSEIALEVVPCLPVGLPGGFAEWAGGIDSAVKVVEVVELMEQRISFSSHNKFFFHVRCVAAV